MFEELLIGTRFKSLRAEQEFAVNSYLTSDKSTWLGELPTGIGKSLIGWIIGKSTGRTLILTATKGQMDQYERDFESAGLVDLRGMGNYPCRALPAPLRCDSGPCLEGDACIWRQSGCAYYDRETAAGTRQMVLSNYSKWFTYPDLGKFDLIVCDEGHDVASEVTKNAGAAFHSSEIDIPNRPDWSLWDWQDWAGIKKAEAYEVLKTKSNLLTPTERRDVRMLAERLSKLTKGGEGWAVEHAADRVSFEPVSASTYTESLLFRKIPRRVIMSATLGSDTPAELGVAREDMTYLSLDSPFPVANRPIYWVKLGFRMNAKVSGAQLEHWVATQDGIIAREIKEKGIIHTVSYERARYLKANSKFGAAMLIHPPSDLKDTVERFKRMKDGILVSPSVHTGYDFPYDHARWQIIAKVPFPNCTYGIAKARKEADDNFDKKFAAKRIVQMAGRVVRAADDCGRTYITDDAFGFLFDHYRPYFARWFRQALRPVRGIQEAAA